MVAQRAFVHMLRALVSDPAEEAPRLRASRLESQLAVVRGEQPQRIRGRMVFLADCMSGIAELPASKKAE
eukprot:983197-Alexandrium_andersonii.AAC.1